MERQHCRLLLTILVTLFVSSYVAPQPLDNILPTLPVPVEGQNLSIELHVTESLVLPNLTVSMTKPYPFEDKVCLLPKKVGRCKARMSRYYFNSKSGRCESFYYGGCQGNGNNFLTLRQCQRRCVCSLPKETGYCRAAFRRFFYNPIYRKCEQFIYGGCGGNANNFMNLDECQGTCIQDAPEKDACYQERETGPCRAKMPRYYFDPSCHCCKRFIYGGCKGNDNNFKTLRQCEDKCTKTLVLNI
ncbi:hypothetical protein CHS0354_037681 [Potamilus streckersoni]|nr:hypothetical protein CHS0354_037681 [Potamilus streckersoni]